MVRARKRQIGVRKRLKPLHSERTDTGMYHNVTDLAGMSDELKINMRARIEQCRRLAKYVNDPRTTDALLRMADDGEADLARLEAEETVTSTDSDDSGDLSPRQREWSSSSGTGRLSSHEKGED